MAGGIDWAAWLADTKTGAVGPRLPLSGGSCELVLNGIGTWTVQTSGDWLDTIDVRWWYPWVSSVLICHRAPHDTGWQPWMLGPVTALPQAAQGRSGERDQAVTLSGQDMRAMLARRIITGWRDWPAPQGTWAFQHEYVRWTRMSLGTIAENLVRLAVRRTGGALPVRYRASLYQSDMPNDEAHTRQYDAWNVHNNGCSKLIDDLTGCEGGPDFMLRPGVDWSPGGEGADPVTAYVTVLHGLEGQPQIPQEQTLLWDGTRPGGPVLETSYDTDAGDVFTRAWATGDGEDADVLMDVRQHDAALQAGMPLMERVDSYPSIINHPPLLAHIDETLATGIRPTVQASMTVDARHVDAAPGRWHVGDRVRCVLPATRAWCSWERLHAPYPPQPVDRLLTVTGAAADLASGVVTVKAQDDAWAAGR